MLNRLNSRNGGAVGLDGDASPDLYRLNAFRVLGLAVDATSQQIRRQVRKLDLEMSLGHDCSGDGCLLPLTPRPDDDGVRQAAQRLKDPCLRLVDEFFWFWPIQSSGSDGDPGMAALKRNDIQTAIDTWSKQEKGGNHAPACARNLAVLAHALALDLEHKADCGNLSPQECEHRTNYWKAAYLRWAKAKDQDAIWQALMTRVVELDDPRLTAESVRTFRSSFPTMLLKINATLALRSAEKQDRARAQSHIQLMRDSGFGGSAVSEVLHEVTAPIRERMSMMCKAAESETDATPEQGWEAAKRLFEQTKPLLSAMDMLMPAKNAIRSDCCDEVALTLLRCQIVYANKTDRWDVAQDLLEWALGIAASDSARQRLKENLQIVKKNRALGQCWFCGAGQTESGSEIEVKLHGDITRTPTWNGVHVQWRTLTIKVPRCRDCMSSHARESNYTGSGCVLGGIAGLATCVGIGNATDNWGLAIFALVGLLGGLTGLFSWLGKRHSKPGTKAEGAKNEFPSVKEALSQGYQFGERPPNVQ